MIYPEDTVRIELDCGCVADKQGWIVEWCRWCNIENYAHGHTYAAWENPSRFWSAYHTVAAFALRSVARVGRRLTPVAADAGANAPTEDTDGNTHNASQSRGRPRADE